MTDAFEPQMRALLKEWPRMPAPVIAERIGWPYSSAPLRKRLALIRPEYVGIDPIDRVTYEPGQIAQCDLWFPETKVQVAVGQERVVPVLVMALGVLPVHDRDDDPDPAGRRHPLRHVVADQRDRPSAEDVGLGPGVRDRRDRAGDRSRGGVRRDAGDQDQARAASRPYVRSRQLADGSLMTRVGGVFGSGQTDGPAVASGVRRVPQFRQVEQVVGTGEASCQPGSEER
ncbi:hypothetical protein AB0D12_40775 [Streptomyces sp. NPDC048479]|uniref:hypothetical protein n=1 Tax=Streptomyces sp. NPDC048479 TaxID=3154725 RepID=UPI00343C991D